MLVVSFNEDEKDALMVIRRLGAFTDLTKSHLEQYVEKDLSHLNDILYLDSYVDRQRPIKEEIDFIENMIKPMA